MIRKAIILATAAIAACSCAASRVSTLPVNEFPEIDQNGKIAIVAHRGFWECEQAGYSENSIAALQAAIDNGFWGCELDVHLTADGVVMVNHDGSINGKEIATHNFGDFDADLLPNGERRPSLDEYLRVAAKDRKITLVLEFKSGDPVLIQKSLDLLRKYRLLKPERVVFISFSKDACMQIATLCPRFRNQYLNGNLSPDELSRLGINGLDYGFWEFNARPEWVRDAKTLGMSTNAWTVDYEGNAQQMIDLGVDAITTNKPLMVRFLLQEREFRK